MKSFYRKTYYFWVLTKALFAIAGFMFTFSVLLDKGSIKLNLRLVDLMLVIYTVLLLMDALFSLAETYYKALKYITGTLSIILGIVLAVIFVDMEVILPYGFLFVIWLVLLGLFDVLQTKRIKEYDYETGE